MREKSSSDPARTLEKGRAMSRRAHEIIPGGAHTYAKGDDQFPINAPGFMARGKGCHAWDADGNEYIEYGMGLRAVTLGHAFDPVVAAVAEEITRGSNFTRPSVIELEYAEMLCEIIPGAEMVKFAKDGSDTLDAAVRLARAHTGRDKIAICGDQPFFSTSDWFIGTTEMNAGIPKWIREQTVKYKYNDVASVRAMFDQHPGQIACAVLEAARIEEPRDGFLSELQKLCRANGTVLIFDEMITGFRWHLSGAQHVYGVVPDLSTWGKAMANGFALSALAGRREIMELGGSNHSRERVFLLSTTHGAETHAIAAGIATARCYRELGVVEALHERGARLRRGVERAVAENGLQGHFGVVSRDCNLLFFTFDADKKPSQPLRTVFQQELIRRGIIAPSFVVSYSHTEADIDRTIEAIFESLAIYKRALTEGHEKYLEGRPVKPVFRRFA